MSFALQNAEVTAKRAHRLAILERHHACHLVKMGEIMRCPGGQQLAKRHHAQSRMPPRQRQLLSSQVQVIQRSEIPGTQARKFIQQFPSDFPSISWIKANRSSGSKVRASPHSRIMRTRGNQSARSQCARCPTMPIAFQVTSPVQACPGLRQIAQQRIERGRRARQQRLSIVQGYMHRKVLLIHGGFSARWRLTASPATSTALPAIG